MNTMKIVTLKNTIMKSSFVKIASSLATLLLSAVILLGCDNNYPVQEKIGFGMNVVTVNNCQYIVYFMSDAVAMVHAGNCNNKEHKIISD